jgi:hypothetical protein
MPYAGEPQDELNTSVGGEVKRVKEMGVGQGREMNVGDGGKKIHFYKYILSFLAGKNFLPRA